MKIGDRVVIHNRSVLYRIPSQLRGTIVSVDYSLCYAYEVDWDGIYRNNYESKDLWTGFLITN